MGSPGHPLPASERTFFEPRFGRDLSNVRIHDDRAAGRAARAINARAYTLGHDVSFGSGEYAPGTATGRQLLAHELAHVVQDDVHTIRRATYGTGTPPDFSVGTVSVVPQDDRDRVDAAMARIDELVSDRDGFSECHDHFADLCPGGSAATLATVWNRALIWKLTGDRPTTLARGNVNGADIAYTPQGYARGANSLAATLLHEAGHNCGIPGDSTHWRADQISTWCLGPEGGGRNEFSITGGAYLGQNPAIMFSYRRFLGDWVNGRIRLTLGADFGALGTSAEIIDTATETPERFRTVGEFGSAMGGLDMRLGGWGGTGFGGISLRLETGFGAGRFPVSPDAGGDGGSMIAGSWVLQVGPHAEFQIPLPALDTTIPVSLGAAWRLVEPLNADAEQMHGLMGSLEIPF